ncbi:interstitial collagenase isoform X2 [Tupaia chinensis]|nr:interstitial collagenase isoform X2 [Tupaia chinensis]
MKQVKKQGRYDPVVEKLKQMQEFFGLKVTGKADADTLDLMKKPRCGVPDAGSYVLTWGNPHWKHRNLTYRIINYTPDLPREDVDCAIEKAFDLWSKATVLTFTKVHEGEADILLSFLRGDHHDNSPFNGPGGQLAHAFQPGAGLGGDVHLDEDETWTDDFRDYNLLQVVAHELGHSLGLSHSKDIGALMYPNYIFTGDVLLSQDDIDGIQAIYGPSKNPITGPRTPQICDTKLTFDAVTKVRGEVFFLKDRFFIRYHPYHNPQGTLSFITDFWSFLPSNLEAAYNVPERDENLFFKGSKYWVIKGDQSSYGRPRDIYSSFRFPKRVKKIDAAVHEEESGKTYFFVADEYWRYDEYKRSMDVGYPKKIIYDFPGINDNVDAVFQNEGYFYFFIGKKQYKFDPKTKRTLAVLKTNSWFKC